MQPLDSRRATDPAGEAQQQNHVVRPIAGPKATQSCSAQELISENFDKQEQALNVCSSSVHELHVPEYEHNHCLPSQNRHEAGK